MKSFRCHGFKPPLRKTPSLPSNSLCHLRSLQNASAPRPLPHLLPAERNGNPGSPATASLRGVIHEASIRSSLHTKPYSSLHLNSVSVHPATQLLDEMSNQVSLCSTLIFRTLSLLQSAGFADSHSCYQLYAAVHKSGLFVDAYVCSGMIDLLAKLGELGDAFTVFGDGAWSNVVCWNVIISGSLKNGESLIALEIFRDMLRGGFCVPNGFTFSIVMSACAAQKTLDVGKAVHSWVVKCGSEEDVFIGTAIVDFYAKCGNMVDAMKQFWTMPTRNVVSWGAAISGFVQSGEGGRAMNIFKDMMRNGMEMNKYTLTSILVGCSKSAMVQEAEQIHCIALKKMWCDDIVVKEAFITTYAHLGCFRMLEKVFSESSTIKNSRIWSAIISGFSANNLVRSVDLLKKMLLLNLRPESKCLSFLLSNIDSIELGVQLHSYLVKVGLIHEVLVASVLSTMYSKCGAVDDSYKVFERMLERDAIAWTSMIAGYASHGYSSEAFRVFGEMIIADVLPDPVAISAVLSACNGQKDVLRGKELHGYAFRIGFVSNPAISRALVSMYSKCRDLSSSVRVFCGAPAKDQTLWSSLVSGHATNGYYYEALAFFKRMLVSGFQIDLYTCSSILDICGHLYSPDLCRQLHGCATKAGMLGHLPVCSAFVAAYAKCSRIGDARELFEGIDDPDLVTWTTLIDGYAQHGSASEALKLYQSMIEDGIRPDAVTLVSVLSACSRNGLIDEGFAHFNSMRDTYGIKPEIHHYACMVDLLGRSGRLKDALEFIENMPTKPDSFIWSTFLSTCRIQGDAELGKLAGKKVLEADSDSGSYVSAANVAAEIGDWRRVEKIRLSMEGENVAKEPGWSFGG